VKARILASLDAWQRRHAWLAFGVGVVRKFGEDRASRLAALIAYYAFFSLFPLLLVFVSVLGFVLQDNPELQEDIVDSTVARIPVIGAQLGSEVEPLTGSTLALVVGLLGALWAGLGVTLALGQAFERIWDVPRVEQRGAVRARVRGLILLVALGLALIASTVITGLATGGGIGPGAQKASAVLLGLVANAILFLAVFALLTPGPPRLGALLPGVALTTAGSLVLQAAGGWYVDRAVVDASDTYGTFALVIGLMSWFWLGAHLLLLAAEVNVVRDRRLWPRSLAGELQPADREALRLSALAAREDARQEIDVRFHS
jgi:membrane protein